MQFITYTITPQRAQLVVGQFLENGSVIAATRDGLVYQLPRFQIETPVLCCVQCNAPAILRKDKLTHKEVAECPNHARHMYEHFYSLLHDTKRWSREQRRDFQKQAVRWLNIWRRQSETRTKRAIARGAQFNDAFTDGVERTCNMGQ
jgi:hypothetical protein